MNEIQPEIQNNEPNEYLNKLKKDLSMVEDKNREFNSKKIVDENKLKETKEKMIQELFTMMKEVGVDPTNLESINAFLAQLSEQDPDLLALFEAALSNLVGGDLEGLPNAPVRNPLEGGSVRPDVPLMMGSDSLSETGSGMPPVPASPGGELPNENTFKNLR